MAHFASYDGTQIGYRVLGDGPPLICLPGGPGRAGEYLGDLGGLDNRRQLIIPDARGVGLSADPEDPETFRVDRLVGDVEALRVHLGLERMDLLAHSAGAILGILYAAAHPDRISALILVTPGLALLGLDDTEDNYRAAMARRENEPWYPDALAAMNRIEAGSGSFDDFKASRPFYYSRWNDTARAHMTLGVTERHQAARRGFFAGVTFDPPATRAALKSLTAPVLLYGGETDVAVTPVVIREAAAVFGTATVMTQPRAAHFPWIEDPAFFSTAIADFLDRSAEHPVA